MSADLKPCPFCGSSARIEGEGNRGAFLSGYWIQCDNEQCYADHGKICDCSDDYYGSFSTEQAAAEAWNLRPEHDRTRELISARLNHAVLNEKPEVSDAMRELLEAIG